MQPPGPPRPFRGAQYDKDMFTFLPAHSKRDVVSEASGKRKPTPDDRQINTSAPNLRHGVSAISDSKLNSGALQWNDIHCSASALQSRESSNHKGYSDQSQSWDQYDLGAKRHRNERGGYESRSEYAGSTPFSAELQSSNQKISSPSFPISVDCTHRTLNFPPVTEDFNQQDNRAANSRISTHTGPNCPPLVTKDFVWCEKSENHEYNAHVATQKTLDCHPPVSQDFFQHKNCESDAHMVAQKMPNFLTVMAQDFQLRNGEPNAHLATHESLTGQPPLPQDLNHSGNQGSHAYVSRVENAPQSQEIWQNSHQKAVQPTVTTSDFPEQSSKFLGVLQRLSQNGLKAGAIEGLAEKGLSQEESQKVGSSSNSKRSDTDISAVVDSITSGNNVSSSVCNLQIETNNLLNVLRLLSAASGIPLADNSDGNSQGCGNDARMQKAPAGSSIENVNRTPVESNLSKKTKNPENCSNLDKPATDVEKGSVKLGDECKSENGSLALAEKLWDGTLQLSTSVSVSAIAFFKSGDKIQDLNWSDSVEVKGKVRLEAFEKYVQDLPRSRSRGLMVMSLCWKEGTSDAGHRGMKEVAKKYKDGRKVGFAKLSSDVDLYICPHSDAIITILAKHGFFKGMIALRDICDPLIGCAVWKKSSSSAPASKTAKTPTVAIENSTRDKSPEFSLSPQANQDKQSMVGPYKNATSVGGTSTQPSVPIVPTQSVASKQSTDLSDNDDDDLPEYDFTTAVSQTSVSKNSVEMKSEISTVSVPVIDSQLLGMVSEHVKQYSDAHKPRFPTLEQKQTEHLQVPSQQNLNQQSEVKIPSLPIQEPKPVEKPRNLFDNDDMPEWCPPDFMKTKKEETKRTEASFFLSNSKIPGSGSADLGSGQLPPLPPLPPPPPPPPLTQNQFKERNHPSALHIPSPSVSSNSAPNNFMHHNIPAAPSTQLQLEDKKSAAISSQMHMMAGDYSSDPRVPLPPPPPPPVGNKAPNNFMHNSSATISSQMQFKERDYSFAPCAPPLPPPPPPPPPVGNRAPNNFMHHSSAAIASQTQFKENDYSFASRTPPLPPPPPPPVGNPAANNLRHHAPAAVPSQMQFKQSNYSSGHHVPPPPVGNPAAANNFMHQSPTVRPTQMQFGDKNYPPATRPPTPFSNKPTSDGVNHQSSAFPPGFAPNPALRPCFDQLGMNPVRSSNWSTRP